MTVGVWIWLGLKVNIFKLIKSIIPGLILCIPVLAADYVLSHQLFTGIINWSSGLLSEIDQIIQIGLHILIAGLATLLLALIIPEFLDGGFPEMRKQLASKLPNSFISKRLSR